MPEVVAYAEVRFTVIVLLRVQASPSPPCVKRR